MSNKKTKRKKVGKGKKKVRRPKRRSIAKDLNETKNTVIMEPPKGDELVEELSQEAGEEPAEETSDEETFVDSDDEDLRKLAGDRPPESEL